MQNTSLKLIYLVALLIGFFSLPAHALEVGDKLPEIKITMGGQLGIDEERQMITQSAWASKELENQGKIQVVQYLAANMGIEQINKPFTDALEQAEISTEKVDTTVILHMADTIPFAKGIVRNEIAKNKVKHRETNFVIDEAAVGLANWGMMRNSFAVIILDGEGKILFAKDGAMDNKEIDYVLNMLKNAGNTSSEQLTQR